MADEDLSEKCRTCLVRDSSMCATLCDSELVRLSRIGRRKLVPAGAVVMWEGDENGLVANIVSGHLKLVKSLADGREQAVGLLSQGDFYGQLFSTTGSLTAVALEDTEMCLFPRTAFEQVMNDQPKLERTLLERTVRSLNEAQERQLTLARKGARSRIASLLLQLAGDDKPDAVTLPMSRGDIAEYLGLTIETVSRQFTDLKAAGVIDVARGSRSVTVRDYRSLQSMVED